MTSVRSTSAQAAAFDCDEQPCGADHPCTPPDWYCRPADATELPTCTQSVLRVTGACDCFDGHSVPFACGTLDTCEALCEP